MTKDDAELQDQEWKTLFDRVSETLRHQSKINAFVGEDYWILGDNWGHQRKEIEVRNLSLLLPSVVASLQSLLADYQEWEIAIGLDILEKFKGWSAMGVVVRSDEIVDGLQRQHFPEEFQGLVYEGRTRKLGAVRAE